MSLSLNSRKLIPLEGISNLILHFLGGTLAKQLSRFDTCLEVPQEETTTARRWWRHQHMGYVGENPGGLANLVKRC